MVLSWGWWSQLRSLNCHYSQKSCRGSTDTDENWRHIWELTSTLRQLTRTGGSGSRSADLHLQEHMLDINLFHFRVPVSCGTRLLGLWACEHLLADEIVPQLPHPHGCPSFSLIFGTQVTRSTSNNQDELWMYLYVPKIIWILKSHLKFKITKSPPKITFAFFFLLECIIWTTDWLCRTN